MPVSGGVGERSAADGASVGVGVAGPKDRVPANTPLIVSPHASVRERHHDFQLKSRPRNKTRRSRYVFTRPRGQVMGFQSKTVSHPNQSAVTPKKNHTITVSDTGRPPSRVSHHVRALGYHLRD